MKQMITRLEDELHSRLKEWAATEGRSVNELVIEALTEALDGRVSRRSVRERARATGRLVVPDPPARTVRRHVIVRGSGDSVSEALAEERSAR